MQSHLPLIFNVIQKTLKERLLIFNPIKTKLIFLQNRVELSTYSFTSTAFSRRLNIIIVVIVVIMWRWRPLSTASDATTVQIFLSLVITDVGWRQYWTTLIYSGQIPSQTNSWHIALNYTLICQYEGVSNIDFPPDTGFRHWTKSRFFHLIYISSNKLSTEQLSVNLYKTETQNQLTDMWMAYTVC